MGLYPGPCKYLLLMCLIIPGATPVFAQKAAEKSDYFKKWLNEDVVYLITPEER